MSNASASPTAIGLTVLAAIGRLIPHPANMTPIGASSLFGGAILSRPWNYLLPILTMFVTDIFLGFHGTMLYVYISILIGIILAEKFLKTNRALSRVGLLSIANATLFFIVTNYGVWASSTLYPKTLAGLYQCYIMGLPFFGNMLVGDLMFGLGFFALYSYAEKSAIVGTIDSWAIRSLQLAKVK